VDAPLLAHPDPKSVCIIGGGDCFGLEEAAKHRSLRRILMVEIDKGVVDFCRKHYPAVRRALADRRIAIVYEDARAYLERHPERFDCLIVDLTEPHGPSKMLYTREFYQLTSRRLTPRGILSIHTDNYNLFPESFATILKTLTSVYAHTLTARVDMPCFGMGWTYRLASHHKLSLPAIRSRFHKLQKQGIRLDQFTPSSYLLEPTGQEKMVLKKYGRVSMDKRPFDKFEKFKKYVTR
jgi:spermidine synthase